MAKSPNFISQSAGKQIGTRESTTKGVSFEWSHRRFRPKLEKHTI